MTEMQVCLVYIERVYISLQTDFDPRNEITVFIPLAFGSKTSNLGFSGFLTVFLSEVQIPVVHLCHVCSVFMCTCTV